MSTRIDFASLSTSEKTKLLNKEFDRIDVNHDQILKYEELCQALDAIGEGKTFDRDVARQLYDEMDRNHDGVITRKEFVGVFLDAERTLLDKIQKCKEVIRECQSQHRETEMKWRDAERNERFNTHKIKEDSVVTVTVIEVTDLQVKRGQQIYVQVACGTDIYEKTPSGTYTNKAVINDHVNVAIVTGKEIIRILICADIDGRQVVLGEIRTNLEGLRDQAVHSGNLELSSTEGKPVNGFVQLSMQWIHSAKQYLKEVLAKWEEHIENTKQDLLDYEDDLRKLYEPFKNLAGLKGLKKSDIEDPFLKWLRYGTYVTVMMLSFAFLACFSRNVFFDLAIGLIYLLAENTYFHDTAGFRVLFIALGASVVFDLPWLMIYSSGWSVVMSPGEELTANARAFSLVMSYFLFGVKLVAVYVYWRVDKEYKIFRENNVTPMSLKDRKDLAGIQVHTQGQPLRGQLGEIMVGKHLQNQQWGY
mmetsp:Transcript_14763/g.16952  ORF Transcript_14763/g.16952 Transcript_14763/m.16952 type:complete len:475 (+) Transcript_14763:35-1459(+)